ncbi:GNAT family N-acetyltransferase [Chitinibacter bivalviorum]|uniref:GNAT family N-acetyltransferase n=1 Tax=Chitinibacter bivalviorum TaxID=2739434 RepID=A0A7H9BPZ1_9NEIS|nr:GNAT family protein [Chitinibacter bivalviorum]QLG89414.1 GNAT family N-acetyltransferase [Chitinibacter bivalviorum]
MNRDIYINEFGQPLGPIVENWQGAAFPIPKLLAGWGCRLEPLDADAHAQSLWQAFAADSGAMWTYFSAGPYDSFRAFHSELATRAQQIDPQYYAIVDASSGLALGLASYLRIDPKAGSIEVGWLHFSPALQRTRLATAAMVLMMEYAFELGFRRYEWKCNNLNAPSKRAAERLGFTFEGIFRQATVNKGRSRDTAWFSILDSEWPDLRKVYEAWLAVDNFDANGQQRQKLSEFMRK